MKKSTMAKILCIAVVLIFGFIYYYNTLPAINIHSPGLWGFIIIISAALTLASGFSNLKKMFMEKTKHVSVIKLSKTNHLFGFFMVITVVLVVIYGIGSFFFTPQKKTKQNKKGMK